MPILTLAAPLRAQQPPDVTLKLDVVAWGDEIGGLSFKASEKNKSVTALAFRYSDPVSYTGPALMEIYKNGDGTTKPKPPPSEEDLKHQLMPLKVEESAASKDAPKTGLALELEKRRQKAPNLVALAQIPSGCVRATILLAPAGDNTFLAYVIDDNPTKLPVGQLRVHNLSPYSIAMRLNGAGGNKEIKTKGTITVPATDEQLSYDLAYQEDKEWKFQEHNFMQVFAKDQTQMIILKSNNSFFKSADGASGGFLQVVMLRRTSAP